MRMMHPRLSTGSGPHSSARSGKRGAFAKFDSTHSNLLSTCVQIWKAAIFKGLRAHQKALAIHPPPLRFNEAIVTAIDKNELLASAVFLLQPQIP